MFASPLPLGGRSSCGYAPHFAVLTKDLPRNRSRTATNGPLVFEVLQKQDLTVGSVSNYYTQRENATGKLACNADDAKALVGMSPEFISALYVKCLGSDDPNLDVQQKVMILTGFDTTPRPQPQCIPEYKLKKKRPEELQAICTSLNIEPYKKKSGAIHQANTAKLIIAKQLENSQNLSNQPLHNSDTLNQAAWDAGQPNATICNNYGDWFNGIDKLNKTYYSLFKYGNERSYMRLHFMALSMYQLINAFHIHRELAHRPNTQETAMTFATFVLRAIKYFLAPQRGKAKGRGAPKKKSKTAAKAQAESWKANKETAKKNHEEMMNLAKQNTEALASKMIFDVGGTLFSTTKETLLRVKDSYFTSMLESGNWKPQEGGTYFIDGDATCFGRILNYMRYDELDTVGLSAKQNKMLQADFDYFFPNQEWNTIIGKPDVDILDALRNTNPPKLSMDSCAGNNVVNLLSPSNTQAVENKYSTSNTTPWVCYEFQHGRVKLTAYSIKQDADFWLRNWNLEGSNDGKQWTVVKKHVNDRSINVEHKQSEWILEDCGFWTNYRIILTGDSELANNSLSSRGLRNFDILYIGFKGFFE